MFLTVRYALLVLELLLLFIFVWPLPVFCAGNIAGMLFSFALLAATYYDKRFIRLIKRLWSSAGGKCLLIGAGLLIVVGIVYVTVLSVKMYRAQEKTDSDSKVVVVLGCQVKGTRPSLMLSRRLNAAYELLEKDDEMICVVSGGKGWNEKISEAQCMREYLIEKGIAPERIISEDKSTNTYENLKFTRQILDERGLGRDIIIATDAFHEYRASLIAEKLDYGKVSSCPAYTKLRYMPTYWVREWIGLTHYFIFGN